MMRISVNVPTAEVTLDDPTVFNAFDLKADPIDTSEADIAAALGAVGSAAGDDHLWISIDEVQRLAGSAVTSEWESNFEVMVAYAASMEWTNEDQTMLKAHIARS